MKQHVFVYGTLKEGFGNHRVLSSSRKVGEAITCSDSYSMIDGGFPTVVLGGKFHVKGELYEVVDERIMQNLDWLEGVPTLFDHHKTQVKCVGTTGNDEVYDALMYVGANPKWTNGRNQVIPNEENILEWN